MLCSGQASLVRPCVYRCVVVQQQRRSLEVRNLTLCPCAKDPQVRHRDHKLVLLKEEGIFVEGEFMRTDIPQSSHELEDIDVGLAQHSDFSVVHAARIPADYNDGFVTLPNTEEGFDPLGTGNNATREGLAHHIQAAIEERHCRNTSWGERQSQGRPLLVGVKLPYQLFVGTLRLLDHEQRVPRLIVGIRSLHLVGHRNIQRAQGNVHVLFSLEEDFAASQAALRAPKVHQPRAAWCS